MTHKNSDAQVERRQAGDILFREGDAAGYAYIIEDGRVLITVERDGQPFVLGELGSGEILGEMAMIDEFSRTATATVVEDCRLTVVTPRQIQQRIDNSDPVVRSLLRILMTRYRSELKLRQSASPSVQSSLLTHYGGIRKIQFENELIQALRTGEVKVSYQPIYRLAPMTIVGFEALVRWEHPELGPIPSAYLVNLAEETDLINALESHVFRVATEDLGTLKEAAPDELFVSVNVSPRHTTDLDFLSQIHELCVDSGRNTGDVVLELTESVLVNVEQLSIWARDAHEMGFRLTVDDFGTGFASLEYLTRLAPDIVKIDRSFIGSIVDNERTVSVLRRVLEMARDLNVQVIAEGVETADHFRRLEGLKCDMAQGFHFGRPVPCAEAVNLLSDP